MKYDAAQTALSKMSDLLKERREREAYDHYHREGHYKPDSIFRHSGRKGSLRIANAIAVPVRYDSDWNVTHVLCWVPQSQICRWISMKTGRFLMNDLTGLPEHLHSDGKFIYEEK